MSAHYWTNPDGVPRLGAVTAFGRTGPQVLHAGIPLVGAVPSSLGAAILQHVEGHDLGLCFSLSGAMTPAGVNLALDTARAGDATVSEPTFYTEQWEMQGARTELVRPWFCGWLLSVAVGM
ncbi:hypothetical protein [Actinacidiphila glaucinigra]|uniref:hypothetical protein n=1 Tax=Actinacidiphila glaucinigra TaxID=235986 RepID=UPI00367052AC